MDGFDFGFDASGPLQFLFSVLLFPVRLVQLLVGLLLPAVQA